MIDWRPPPWLEDALGTLALVYHWPPRELHRLTLRDLQRWERQAQRVIDARKQAQGG